MALSGPDAVRAVMGEARCLLLDFDGPVCDIFAGLPASTVAASLRATLEEAGAKLPAQARATDDPLEVFRLSASLGDELNQLALRALMDLEVKAAGTARPTPGAADLMERAHDKGLLVAIVSNNSVAAVTAFLDREGFGGLVQYVSARAAADPSLMKPSPYLLEQALSHLDAEPSSALLVGDSVTDVEASKLAGVVAVGFANRPGKLDRLGDAGADLLVTSIEELADALTKPGRA
ncbi:HAD family hydrolase [Nonomuraea sp. NPDC050451]|uniref:HAD family hydrolase n=1 Tax=Nonomuraea sp. NPDC050451 TaxID=3364364 RepID=UPI00379E38A0